MTTISNKKQKKLIKSPYIIYDSGDLLFTEERSSYKGRDVNLPYVLKVRDMNTEDKPREKMLSLGINSLSITELLAIVLNTGTKKEDVMTMAHRIVQEYGKSALTSTERGPEILSKELNIPIVKACQIIAIAEIGKRLFKKNEHGLTTIRLPEDVFDYVQDMKTLPKEQLRGLYLDTHNRIIHDEILSIGTINASMLHPREVLKPAIEYNAAAFILVHNHPSGISTPSSSDIKITEQIIEAGKVIGIHLLDHIIVTKDSFTSVPASY